MNLTNKIEELLKYLGDPERLKEIGEYIETTIRGRTRTGWGVSIFSGPRIKLTPLAPSTVRMRLKKVLHGLTNPSKSNLTDTGQMLNDITYTTSRNSIRVFFKTERSDTIALYHETGTSKMPARPFFHLTKTEAKEVNRILERNRNEFIRRNFSQ